MRRMEARSAFLVNALTRVSDYALEKTRLKYEAQGKAKAAKWLARGANQGSHGPFIFAGHG